ncbi:MAG TPA: carboxypeptidase-like regulatory domain-containing protein [Pirellulaceae bacterium]|nr:carboxypeptidase-like regulatory domain-containing protein [Pirellulaceae bacterium]
MKRVFAVAFASLLVLAAGCGPSGPSLGAVTGKVTLDDKPLANVSVVFMPVGEGGTASAITDANGNYELGHQAGKGAPVGKNKVSVTTVQQSKSTVDMSNIPSDSPEYAKMAAGGSNAAEYNVQFTEPIPAKYNTQTTLEFDVKSGKQVINLDLKSS